MLCAVMTAALALCCDRNNPEPALEPKLEIINTELNVSYEGGTNIVRYKLENPSDKLQINFSNESDWIDLNLLDDEQIEVTVSPNTEHTERMAEFEVIYGEARGNVKVFQEACPEQEDPQILVKKDSYEFTHEAASGKIEYSIVNPQEELDVNAETEDEWISVDELKNDGEILFSIAGNDTDAVRDGKITIVYGKIKKDVVIRQEAAPAEKITVSPSQIFAESKGGIFSIDYIIENPRQELAVKASSEADWIGEFDYSAEGTIKFTVFANETIQSRETVINVTYGTAQGQVTVGQQGHKALDLEISILSSSETEVSYSIKTSNKDLTYIAGVIPDDGRTADAEAFISSEITRLSDEAGEKGVTLEEYLNDGILLSGDSDYRQAGLVPDTEYVIYGFGLSGDAGWTGNLYTAKFMTSQSSGDEVSVGDYFYSDGTFSSELDENKECIGIVFKTGHHENDPIDYSNTGIGLEKCHGYVVALKDATDELCSWGVSSVALGLFPKDEFGTALDNFSDKSYDNDWGGFAYTDSTRTYAESINGLHNWSEAGFPATFYAFKDYQNDIPAPASTSGWFLPSISQLVEICNIQEILQKSGKAEPLKEEWYWSSSEKSQNPSFYALMAKPGSEKIGYNDKWAKSALVRAILAF